MIGIILAAGVGSRLRPMTTTKPKSLVTTAGKAILQYQIDSYIKAGIKELYIVVGYEGDAIKKYCQHIKDIKIHIIDNENYENTNNMYSLYLAKKFAYGKAFILNNADLSIDIRIVEKLVNDSSEDSIAVDSSLYNEESMKVSIDQSGYISDISKNINEQDAFACSIDFYKFSSKSSKVFFDEIERIIETENNLKDWTEVAMQRLFKDKRLKFTTTDITGLKWVEIDNYQDLALSDRLFSEFDEEIDDFENILFDLDGTIYVGGEIVPGAASTIEDLRRRGKKIYFLSNNSSKSKNEYVERLSNIGIDCSESEIVLSTDALVEYLLNMRVQNIHVLGTNSLKKTLIDEGFNIDSNKPEFVVVGYDTELNYQKLITACGYINKNVDILATHSDNFCPSENGPIPDIGALLSMLKLTTGKTAKKVFGKPSNEMINPLINKFNLNPKKTLLVGDRLHTDILMAKQIGCYGLLVLTGETTRDQLEFSQIEPDFVLTSINEMYNNA